MTYETTDYNPYIHGTTSTGLASMAHMNHQLMPILTMLSEYQLAPITGEINGGGFTTIGQELVGETYAGTPSFGRVKAEEQHYGNGYTLERVVQEYTHFPPLSFDKCYQALQGEFTNLFQTNYNNFHLFLLYYARAHQLNSSKVVLLSPEQIQAFEEGFKQVITLYHVIEIVFSGHILPNKENIKTYMTTIGSKYTNPVLDEWFSYANLLSKCNKFSIKELSAILEKPSEKNITSFLNKLEVPLNLFNVKLAKSCSTQKEAGYLQRIFIYQESPSQALSQMMHGSTTLLENISFPAFQVLCKKHRAVLKERFDIFNKIRNAKHSSVNPDVVKLNEFPVVLVTESSHIEPYVLEYRSRIPLKLGKNIHLIATEKEEDRKELKAYLDKCKLDNIQVILINDLNNPEFRPQIREIDPEIKAYEATQTQKKTVNNNDSPPENPETKNTDSKTNKDQPAKLLKKTYYAYEVDEINKTRWHAFKIKGNEFNLSPALQHLKGDYLKSKILIEIKNELNQLSSKNDITLYVKNLENDEKMKVLKKGQGITTRFFGLKTSSLKAVEKMIEKRQQHLEENNRSFNNFG